MSENKKGKKRLYRKNGRFYADFRDFKDVGGGQEALIPKGERFATTDRSAARRLGKARHKELLALRKRPAEPGVDLTRLGDFVDHHLLCEALETDKSRQILAQLAQQLNFGVECFGSNTRLRDVNTPEMEAMLGKLRDEVKVGSETQRKYLNAFSKMFRRARSLGIVSVEHDPIGMIVNKPKRVRREKDWLPRPEAVLLLEAARLYTPCREDLGLPYAYALVATMLLTGGRPAEVYGLTVMDLDFEAGTIRFRPHTHRRMKNDESVRTVRMWPQLMEILREYLEGPHAPAGRLLFPSPKDAQKPLGSAKKLLQELSVRMGRQVVITPKVTRHTYCSERLQTTDGGAPVAEITVAAEMGHGSTVMVREIYSHVGVGRPNIRKDVVEFQLEPHKLQLKAQLDALRLISAERNTHGPNLKNRVPEAVEVAVIERGLEMPDLGPRKIAALLLEEGVAVSPSGVRWIWKRHGLERSEKRVEAARSGRMNPEVRDLKRRAA